jgi:hypothetical protein
MFRSNEEPQRGLEPLRIDLVEDRFEYLRGKTLVKEEKTVGLRGVSFHDREASAPVLVGKSFTKLFISLGSVVHRSGSGSSRAAELRA